MASSTNIHGFNIGGNNNSFDQRGHFYRGVFSGNVTGMLVKQNSTPNMTVLVEHGSALLNKNTISASIAEIKSDTSVAIDTANTSNPRIDSVVIYEDTSVTIPTVEANYWQDGAGGRFKIVSLPGTAAAAPTALTDANIQSAIGAGKPWARLADITVPANSTTILNSTIVDKRRIISPQGIWWEELGRDSSSSSRTSFNVTIPARKFLRIYFNGDGTGNGVFALRFNNQAGATDYERSFAVLDNSYSRVSGNTSGVIVDWSVTGSPLALEAFGRGVAVGANWKTFEIQASGNAGGRTGTLRHKSSADITTVSIVATSGTFAFGDLIVLGHD